MRLDEYEIETPKRKAVQLERLSPCLTATKYDQNNRPTIILDRPVDMTIKGVRWLLSDAFCVHQNLKNNVEIRGCCRDETSSEANTRSMMLNYLVTEPNVVQIKEIIYHDQHRRWAVGTNGVRYPTDISIEALLSLAGHGAVAHAIVRYDTYTAYRVSDAHGIITCVSPFSEYWLSWFEQSERGTR